VLDKKGAGASPRRARQAWRSTLALLRINISHGHDQVEPHYIEIDGTTERKPTTDGTESHARAVGRTLAAFRFPPLTHPISRRIGLDGVTSRIGR
jgi:hypothetical protein